MRNHTRKLRRHKQGLEFYSTDLVDATEVREHLKFLQTKGVGLAEVARLIGTHRSNIQKIRRGEQKQVKVTTSDKILAISALNLSKYAFVDAKPAKKIVNDLVRLGIPKTEIGFRLGNKYGHLVIKKKVRLFRLEQLQALHEQVRKERGRA